MRTALPRIVLLLWVLALGMDRAEALVLAGPPFELSQAGFVEASGQTVYVASGPGLLILDASDPSSGYVQLGSLPGSFGPLDVDGALVYVMGSGALRIVDASDPANPVEIGSVPIPGSVHDVEVVGGLVFLAQSPFTLRIVDVSAPTAPVERGALAIDSPVPEPSLPPRLSVAVGPSVAYLADTHNGIVGFVDIDDPASPDLIRFFEFLGAPLYSGGNVRLHDETLLLAGNADYSDPFGFLIVDVSDPAAPVTLSFVPTSGTPTLLVHGDLVLTATQQDLQVVDISDPTQPVLGGILALNLDSALVSSSGIALTGETAHLSLTGLVPFSQVSQLRAVDLSVPDFPMRGHQPSFSHEAFAASEGLLYAFSSTRLSVYDLTLPLAPSFLGDVAVSGLARDLLIVGDTLYAAGDLRLILFDLTDPTHPQEVATLPTRATALARAGDLLYVGTSSGTLEIYDIGEPRAPVLLGAVTLPGSRRVYELDLAGGIVYATAIWGLYAIDVSDPSTPTFVSSLGSVSSYRSAVLHGQLLYVGSGLARGIHILDVSDPMQLREIGTTNFGVSFTDLEVVGDRLYAGGAAVRVFDISEPTQPRELGGVNFASEFAVVDGIAYGSLQSVGALIAIDFGPEYAPTLEVDIDVSPLDPHNRVLITKPIHLMVALFGSAGLDVREIDEASLAFGPDGARARLSLPIRLNRDHHKDLLSAFFVPEAGIAIGDTSVCLSGETREGRRFRGCDPIQPLAGCGHGYQLALLIPLLVPLRRALTRRKRPLRHAAN